LRGRNAFAELVDSRLREMTPGERRQLDSLLKLPAAKPQTR
jgi:hypothetical protein